jgi:outer membrane protein assembly factor BamB
VYAVNADGTEQWRFPTGSYANAAAALGADGTIYIGSGDNNLYAIDPDGTLKWSYATLGVLAGSPAIGADGTIYQTSYDQNLYAIHGASGGLADSPWPKYMHDPCNRGNVQRN